MAEKQRQQGQASGKAGWSPEETALLFEEIDRAAAQEQPIRRAFESVAQQTGRRPNSIRNYYYTKLREEPGRGKAAFVPFGEQEQHRLVEAMLLGQAEGKSVRSIAAKLGGGEKKAMLRYQNKYRNIAAKQPERIERLMRECGLSVAVEDDARKKLENEINVLYDRLASSLKEENKRLTAVVKRLTDENSLLKLQIKNSY